MKKIILFFVLMICGSLLATVSSTYAPTQYTITSGVTSFSVGWTFFETSDLVVTYTSTAGVDTVLTEGAGAGKYSVSAVNNDYSGGATITTGTSYGSGKITIQRVVPYGQTLDINGDFIPGEPLEQALDKIASQVQQVENSIGRTLTTPATDAAGLTNEFPNAETRALKVPFFDAYGNLTVASPVASGTVLADDSTIKLTTNNVLYVPANGITTTNIIDYAITRTKVATNAIGTAQISNAVVTKAKIENVSAMSLLGNVTTSAAAPAEVTIIDDDTMATAAATNIPTSESVKAYIDAETNKITPYLMYYTGVVVRTGVLNTSYTNILDLSSIGVGTNRAFVTLKILANSTAFSIAVSDDSVTNSAYVSEHTANQGISGVYVGIGEVGYISAITSTNGRLKAGSSGFTGATNSQIILETYQVLK
jgi:hypothetical protein